MDGATAGDAGALGCVSMRLGKINGASASAREWPETPAQMRPESGDSIRILFNV